MYSLVFNSTNGAGYNVDWGKIFTLKCHDRRWYSNTIQKELESNLNRRTHLKQAEKIFKKFFEINNS